MNENEDWRPTRGDRDWVPEIQLYVVEWGDHDEEHASNRLAFHTFDDAADYVSEHTHVGAEFEELATDKWRAEDQIGTWAEIRKTPVTEPRRLLRDDE